MRNTLGLIKTASNFWRKSVCGGGRQTKVKYVYFCTISYKTSSAVYRMVFALTSRRQVQTWRPVSTIIWAHNPPFPPPPNHQIYYLDSNSASLNVCFWKFQIVLILAFSFGWSQSASIRTIKKIGRVSEIREIRTLGENCGRQQHTKVLKTKCCIHFCFIFSDKNV